MSIGKNNQDKKNNNFIKNRCMRYVLSKGLSHQGFVPFQRPTFSKKPICKHLPPMKVT